MREQQKTMNRDQDQMYDFLRRELAAAGRGRSEAPPRDNTALRLRRAAREMAEDDDEVERLVMERKRELVREARSEFRTHIPGPNTCYHCLAQQDVLDPRRSRKLERFEEGLRGHAAKERARARSGKGRCRPPC